MKNKKPEVSFFKIFKEIGTNMYSVYIPGGEEFCLSEYEEISEILLRGSIPKVKNLTTNELRDEIDIVYGENAFIHTITSVVMFGFIESDSLPTINTNNKILIMKWKKNTLEMKKKYDDEVSDYPEYDEVSDYPEYHEIPHIDVIEHMIKHHHVESYIASLVLVGREIGLFHAKKEEECRIMKLN